MKATYRVSVSAPEEQQKRRCLRLLAMVQELHKAGYQLIRIAPGLAPSGCYWRCLVTTADNIRANGWEPVNWESGIARYSSGDEDMYFGWRDAPGKTARELAQAFLERFPDIGKRGAGWDWMYAGWYVTMLGAAEAGDFPVFYADHNVDVPACGLPPAPQV